MAMAREHSNCNILQPTSMHRSPNARMTGCLTQPANVPGARDTGMRQAFSMLARSTAPVCRPRSMNIDLD